MKRSFPILFTLLMMASQLTIAHPGHGNEELNGYSVFHYLTEPVHLFPTVFIVILAVAVVRKLRKARAEKVKKN